MMVESDYTYDPNFTPDPKYPYLRDFLRGKGTNMTFEKAQELKRRISLFNMNTEKQLGALKDDIGYYFSGDILFTELVCSYVQIQQLGYQGGQYGFFEDDDRDSTLTLEQEIRLQYAKSRIWNLILEMHTDSPIKHQKTQEAIDASDFFMTEFNRLCDVYPKSYSEEERQFYTDVHHPIELLEKMSDPTRFFRILRDSEGKIIAYFESRKSPKNPDTQVIQWIFVSESARRAGRAREMWKEFEKWCRKNGYKKVWSILALRNMVSWSLHAALMPNASVAFYPDSEKSTGVDENTLLLKGYIQEEDK